MQTFKANYVIKYSSHNVSDVYDPQGNEIGNVWRKVGDSDANYGSITWLAFYRDEKIPAEFASKEKAFEWIVLRDF